VAVDIIVSDAASPSIDAAWCCTRSQWRGRARLTCG
jgi:hypothetical protein